jgi:hypothetical protein
MDESMVPERLIRYCGADCSQCDTYRRFLTGDTGGVVNPETQYRCCWLPRDYPQGRDCPIRICCDEQAVSLCGQCGQFEECDRMRAFYAQPGYDRLRAKMLEEVARRRPGGVAE